jgi:murein peptide amidase A
MRIESEKTIKENRINAFVYGDTSEAAKTIFLIGRVHGNEPEGEFIIDCLKKKIDERKINSKNRIVLIPCFNPDGKELNIRGNGRAVDLNRNYDTKHKVWKANFKQLTRFAGEAAESEVETKFLIELANRYNPDLVISIHSPLKNINYDGGKKAKKIAVEIAKYVDYQVTETIAGERAFNGSMGCYFGYDKNIPIITIETEPCVVDNYLSDIKKAISFSENNITESQLTDFLICVKRFLDEENLDILYYQKDKLMTQKNTDEKIAKFFKEENHLIDFNKIRKLFAENGKLDKVRAENVLGKITKILEKIIT